MAIDKKKLVQKSKYGLRRAVFSRTGLVALLFLLQAGLLISVMVWFQERQAHVSGASAVLTMIAPTSSKENRVSRQSALPPGGRNL